MVGDGPEGEDVEVFAEGVAGEEDVGGHVRGGWVVDEVADVRRCRHGGRGSGRTAAGRSQRSPVAGLPIEDLEAGAGGVGIDDEDAPRGEGAVDDALLMGIGHHLGELADEVDARGEGEVAVALLEEVIEANRGGIVLEDHGGPELMAGALHGPEDARVLERLDELKLPDRGPLVGAALLLGGVGADRIDADPALRVGEEDVPGLPVLIAVPLVDLLLEEVVAHLPLPVRLADARLLDRPGDDLSGGAIELGPAGEAVEAGAVAAAEGGEDPGVGAAAVGGVAVAEADAEPGGVGQVAFQIGGGEEDERLDKRHPSPPLRSRLVVEELGELLSLEVDELEGIVGGAEPAVGFPGPGAGVAGDAAGAALDLDQKEAERSVDEEIDLVDRAIEGEKLKQRPGPPGLVAGKALADEIEGVALPGIGRLGEARPVGR